MKIPQATPFFSTAANFAVGADTPRDFLDAAWRVSRRSNRPFGAFVCHDIAAARAAADRSTARWRTAGRSRRSTACRSGSRTSSRPPTCRPGRARRCSPAAAPARRRQRRTRCARPARSSSARPSTTEFAATEPRGTRNPHDPERTPGGSSSGSAAAVGCRHGAGRPRHPGGRLDPAAGQLLRLRRLQAERRRDQPRRQLRLLQPELHRRARRHARRCLAGRCAPSRRAPAAIRAIPDCRVRRTSPGPATARAGGAGDSDGRGRARGAHRLPGRRWRGLPKPASSSPTVTATPSSKRSRRR